MGLAILILGLVLFVANHSFVSFRDARAAAIARLGKPIYHSLFGIVSLVSVAVIVWGYRQTPWIDIWSPPAFMRHVTVGLMLIASVLIVAWLIPSHIQAKSRFPLIAATKVWAFAHLLANGDLGSMLMFGVLLAWAIFASIDSRRRKDVAVRPAPVGWINDILVVLLGIALFLALGYLFHPYVIGVPVFG